MGELEKIINKKINNLVCILNKAKENRIHISLDWWNTSVVDDNSQSRLKSFKEVNLLKANFYGIKEKLGKQGILIQLNKGVCEVSKYEY